MSLSPQLEVLLESFVNLCSQVVEGAYIVTNGQAIAGIVIEEDLAKHICRKVVSTSPNPDQAREEWVVCSIPRAMEYSYKRGYEAAFETIIHQQRNHKLDDVQNCEEVSDKEKLAQEPNREHLNETRNEDESKDT